MIHSAIFIFAPWPFDDEFQDRDGPPPVPHVQPRSPARRSSSGARVPWTGWAAAPMCTAT
jgi:hypothetical protein